MNPSTMREVIARLNAAKCRQDVPAAAPWLHPEIVLETPAFHSTVSGKDACVRALMRFFTLFPDYEFEIERDRVDGDTLVCWGTVRMTWTGSALGVVPNGRRTEMRAISEFRFRDGLVCGERFVYDLSELCAQSGVSTDVVRRRVFGAAWEGEAA